MKKFLDINNTDSRIFSYKTSCKQSQKRFNKDLVNDSKANKRAKKLLDKKQIILEMNYWTLQNATT